MPQFRNLRSSRQSGRLGKQVPVVYDKDGWEVPMDRMLQDICLNGPDPIQYPASPSTSSQSVDQDPPLSISSNKNKADCDPISDSIDSKADTVGSSTAGNDFATAAAAAKSPPMPSVRYHPYERRTSHSRRQKPGHIPRPRNAFILFRSDYYKKHPTPPTQEGKKLNQNEFSRHVGVVWNSMSEEEQAPYREMYAKEVIAHQEKYPNYVYNPTKPAASKKKAAQPTQTKRKGPTKRKEPAKRKRTVAKVVDSDSESDSASSFEFWDSASPAPAVRNLRPRHPSYESVPNLSSNPSPAPLTPTPSLTDVASSNESDIDDDQESGDGFVETEDIPELSLGPSVVEPIERPFAPQTDIPTIDLCDRPSTMDNDTDLLFGVRVSATEPMDDIFCPETDGPVAMSQDLKLYWYTPPGSRWSSPSPVFSAKDGMPFPSMPLSVLSCPEVSEPETLGSLFKEMVNLDNCLDG